MDPTFTSSMMEASSRQLNIKLITVSPTNPKSLLVEHGIKSLSSLLVKHLEQVWSWSSCQLYSMLCYNFYSSHNLDCLSSYELTFGQKINIKPDLEVQPDGCQWYFPYLLWETQEKLTVSLFQIAKI